MPKFSGFARVLIIILLALSISGSVFLLPRKAFGQGVVINLPEVAKNVEKPIEKAAEKTYAQIAGMVFKTALSQFLNKIAYDMAVTVATGAPGQKSLIFDDPNYFINLGDSVMGGAIDDIAQSSGFTNILGTTSLCAPADLTTKVNLLLSFKKPAEPLKPKCSLSLMKKGLAESANSFTNSFSLANLSLRFEMGDLEEARNSLRKSLTVEKYLSSGADIDNKLSNILNDLEHISDDTAKLIQGIYQKSISERQAAADGEIEKLSNIISRLNQTQNLINDLKETIVYCNSSKDNCTESSGAGMCAIFVSVAQPNCSAAVSASRTYIDEFQKLQTGLSEGADNLYDGILEKAFTTPDANDPQDISNAFNPEANPMGQFFLIKEAKDRNVNIKIENEKLLQRISKDCEPKKDPISGMNVLPSSAACGLFNFAMAKSTVNEDTYTGIFSQSISIFTNTLAGKLLQTWFEKGVANLYDKGKGKNSPSAADLAAGNQPRGQTAAQEKFLTLLQSNFIAGGPFEVVKELIICPEKGAGPNNCAIDQNFGQAIAERLTLKEAMDKNLLNPKKPFGYIRSAGILAEPSYLNGYPYRSMIILRKFRVIPIGWELAAEWIKDPAKNTAQISYTLKQVVDCYENGPQCVLAANPNPFYHLVDPGWTLLEQPAFCKKQGAGEKVLAEESICSKTNTTDGSCLEYSRNVYRQEYCADEQTCLLKNDDGSCRFYGYCSEDSPFWRLGGSSCNQEYNSCQIFGDKDGKDASYLEHTISSGGCNSGNAGCQWYCEQAPLVCSGGSKNGEPCSGNNDCAPTAGGIVDGVCRPTDLWKCQGKNLISNPGIEADPLLGLPGSVWTNFGGATNNWINTFGHESFASLKSQSLGTDGGFQSEVFATSAACAGGSNDGTVCTIDTDCAGGGICKNSEVIDASAWVYINSLSSAANSGAGIRIKAYDGSNTQVQFFESERITELKKWMPVHISAPITAKTAKFFLLEAVSYGTNTEAMFDDFGMFRGDRISFDKTVKQCEAKNAGCREFARTTNGANLAFNPGFEIEEKSYMDRSYFDPGWYGWHDASLPAVRDTAIKRSGNASLKINAASGFSIGLETADPRYEENSANEEYKYMPEKQYTLSVYAKAQTACTGLCLNLLGDCTVGIGGEGRQDFPLTASWERYSFTYTKSPGANSGDYCRFQVLLDSSNTYWIDDVKLEIGDQSTEYKDYGSDKIYLNDSRISCDLPEVGCELYTPVDGKAGIPAVVKNGDQCPAECVGYETYHEIPSYFDPVEDAAVEISFPNFIPKTAQICSAQAAGCEEFTNLDAAASGGEAKEYYTRLRQCAKPGTTTEATFYTWEGSEESGFQLRAWKLKAIAGGAPFTTDGSNTCDLDDPDCRVFYTQSGQPYERLLSKTVFISDDCHPLRRTIQGTRQDCESFGGRTDTPVVLGALDIVTCLYDVIPSQGVKCEPKFANCREYKGPEANSSKSLFKYDFEDPDQASEWGIGSTAAESVNVGGHSLEISGQAQRDVADIVQKDKTYLLKFQAKKAGPAANNISAEFNDGSTAINFGSISLTDDWNSYTLGPKDFTSRDPGVNEVLIISGNAKFFIDNIELIEVSDDVFVIKNSWNTPVSCDLNPDGVAGALSVDIDASQMAIPLNSTASFPPSGSILIGSEEISYTVNDTANNKLIADSRGERGTIATAHLSVAKVLFLDTGYMLHCAAYADRAKNIHNLKSFTRLCREDHVGCELLADMQNTQSPFSEWKSAKLAPQDRLAAIVNDDKKYCDGKFKGCQKFGVPQTDASDNTTGWNSAYLINDPDDYKEILCQNTENWCKEFKTADGNVKYFKDPGQKLCEYKENIGVGNTVASGWFIKGKYDAINPPECLGSMRHCSLPRNGSFIFCREDNDCQPIGKNGLPENLGSCIAKDTEWARECPDSQSSCTEYKDSLFSQTQGVKDRYYYLADTMDETICKAKIDEEQKCVAFNNTKNPILNTRASGTCKIDPNVYCATDANCRSLPPIGTGVPNDVCLMKSERPFDPQACTKCSADQLSCGGAGQLPCCNSIVEDLSALPPVLRACNANTILYVEKDRDCREWLSCSSSAKVTNGRGEIEDICFNIARCTKLDPTTGACLNQADEINYCRGNLFCDSGTRSGQACNTNNDCAPVNGPSDGACQPLASPKRCSADFQCMNFQGVCDLALGLCSQNAAKVCATNSDCVINQGPCIADSQTFDNPLQTDHAGAVDDLRYRSGFNPYGLHWLDGDVNPNNDPLRQGEYLLTETMQKGPVINFEDGDFEKQNSAWARFSTCSNTSLPLGLRTTYQCVNNTSCYAGDVCDYSLGQCTVSGTACSSNSPCGISDVCVPGICSNSPATICQLNTDCTLASPPASSPTGTCDTRCSMSNNICSFDPGSPPTPNNSACLSGDNCSQTKILNYEGIKAISGAHAMKLNPREQVFQGNYPILSVGPSDVKPIFVSGNSEFAFSGYIDTADLKGGPINAARVKIQEFKNGDGAFGSINDSTVMQQRSGKPWSFYAGIFRTRPDTVSIRVLLEVDAAASGSAYFDNFLMLPVLNYQNQSYPIPFLEVHDPENTSRPGLNPFIGRSCRLYPQTSAPACFYTDEQKQQFQGWRGFCLEPDPVNPLHCLQWLPIDQLQGEAGLGYKNESSYSGKTPLYYCAEMSLWQLRCVGWRNNTCNRPSQDECPRKGSIDPSCPTTYSGGGGGTDFWGRCNGESHCRINGYDLGPDSEQKCVWVPYTSCPYGSMDLASGISPNLIGRCDKLVEVVESDGSNIAWKNRIEQKILEVQTPYGYIYTANQNAPLYGSILVYGAGNQTPAQWQTSFGKDFISLGGAVRVGTCGPVDGVCQPNGKCSNPPYISCDTTITKNDGTSTPRYPLWIVPKSEDSNLKWCDNNNSIYCTDDTQCGPDHHCVSTDATGQEMACTLSSGGSPMACTSPYCYNNAPNPVTASPECKVGSPEKSFALNVSQINDPSMTAIPKNSAKGNRETFVQGSERLKHLFAKSYSNWVWNAGQCAATDSTSLCTGVCSDDKVTRCIDDTYCTSAAPGVCQTNQETGNSCDTTNTQGYRCSGKTSIPCINESDSICTDNGWGNCKWWDLAVDCNNPAGKCTPAGGGVCQDSATGYVQKVCSAECLGGSCSQIGKCSGNNLLSCDMSMGDSAACNGEGVCEDPAWKCLGGINDGNACAPANNCSTSGIPASCASGGGTCIWGDICDGGNFNGLICDWSGNVTITAETCTNNRCLVGCPGGGICNANICSGGTRDGKSCGNQTSFCIDNMQCNTTIIGGETCQPANAQVCFPGGYDGGDYKAFKSCAVDADCSGTTSYNACTEFKDRCAIQPIVNGIGFLGIEKAGMYCNDSGVINPSDHLPCRATLKVCDSGLMIGQVCSVSADCPNGDVDPCVPDNGVCAANWCTDGPFIQTQCTTKANCVLPNGSPEYQYVDVSGSPGSTFDPRFRQSIWDPPSDQCPNNERPLISQPPTQDIINETAEMCGVAPVIKFIKKPGDSSLPEDIIIDLNNSATISFLTEINAEQGPIRKIAIDWGTSALPQYFHNSESDGIGVSSKTLDTDPFTFTSPPYTISGTYWPKVMVQDNWGWCNLTNPNNLNSGCYKNHSVSSDLNGCYTTSNWLPFPAKIIVNP